MTQTIDTGASAPVVPLKMLKRSEVETKFSVGASTIRRWIAKHGFPAGIELAPGTIRWDEAELDAWGNRNRPATELQ